MSRILVVSAGPFTRQIGGGQTYVQDMVLGLRRRGHQVAVLEPALRTAGSESPLRASKWQGVTVWQVGLPLSNESIDEQASELSPARVELFAALLESFRPDAVQINGLMPTMVQACRSRSVPHVVVAHHPGEVCPKGDLLAPGDEICTIRPSPVVCGPCVLRCKKGGFGIGKLIAAIPYPLLRTAGRNLSQRNPFGYFGRVLYIPWIVEKRLEGLQRYITNAEALVAPSDAIAHALTRSGADPRRVRTISHGIPPLQRSPLTGLGSRPLRFAFVGRIDHAKGLHVLLRAMNKANLGDKAELQVHGAPTNDKDLKEWERLLKEIGRPPWLRLRGPFPREHLESVIHGLDVLVLPAICLEAYGLVVAEALSAGRPVLVTRCGGPAEQITDGVNGWIVEPNNVNALTAKLRLLADKPELVAEAALLTAGSKLHCQYVSEIEAALISRTPR